MSSPAETNNYISLQEATKYCAYTQEYLSLRVRQRKLKGVKFGRNWVTTKDWLEEYLGKIVEHNNNLKNGKLAQLQQIQIQKKEELVRPPENLPVGELKLIPVKSLSLQISEILQQGIKKIIFSPTVRFGLVYGFVFILIIAGIVLEKNSLKEIMADLSAPVEKTFISIQEDEIYSATISGTINVYQEYFDWLGETIKKPISKIGNSAPILAIKETTRAVWYGIKNGFSQLIDEVKRIAFGLSERIAGFFPESVTREPIIY